MFLSETANADLANANDRSIICNYGVSMKLSETLWVNPPLSKPVPDQIKVQAWRKPGKAAMRQKCEGTRYSRWSVQTRESRQLTERLVEEKAEGGMGQPPKKRQSRCKVLCCMRSSTNTCMDTHKHRDILTSWAEQCHIRNTGRLKEEKPADFIASLLRLTLFYVLTLVVRVCVLPATRLLLGWLLWN